MNLFLYETLRLPRGKSKARVCVAFVIILSGVVVVSLLFARYWSGDNSLARIQRKGIIRIGYAVEAPYAFIAKDGKVTGEDPEVARIITRRLGISRIEWHLVEFGSLIDGLKDNQFDVIAAGMFVTPERQQQVAFSLPTFEARPGLLVRKGNPHRLHSYADIMHDNDVRIVVLSGSVEEGRLLQLGFPDARLMRVPDARLGRMVVSSGRADGLVLSEPTLRWMVLSNEEDSVEMAVPFEGAKSENGRELQRGAFAFRKGDVALRKAWNHHLRLFVGSKKYFELVARFGFTNMDTLPNTEKNE